MVVYLEGIDGSGKTTLYNKLHCAYIDEPGIYFCKTLYIHQCNDRLDIAEYEKQLEHQRFNNRCIYVYDRGPISDFAYRMWDGKPSPYNLDDELSRGVGVIYCYTTKVVTSFNNCNEKNKDEVRTINDFTAVDHAYQSLLDIINRWYKCPVTIYNYEKDINDNEWDRVCQYLNDLLKKCHDNCNTKCK